MRTVGIIGGMGPEATVMLMNRIIAATPARDDNDHVPLIVHQNPRIPSRIKRLIDGTGEDPAPVLAGMARDLQSVGAEALAMPCNTAHAYTDAISVAVTIPLLDMRAASVAVLPPGARIGMLASPAVRMVGVYRDAFADAGLTPIFLAEDARLLSLIQSIKAGVRGAAVEAEFVRLAEDLAGQSDHLLLSCTEFSLLTHCLPGDGWTDSLDCLVEAICDFAAS